MNTLLRAVTLAAPVLLCVANASAQPPGDDSHAVPARSGAPDASNLENIIVTGSEPPIEAERTEIALMPGGVSLIDMDSVSERNVGSLADALRFVPGVWSVSDAGSEGIFFSSRGSNLDATDWDMNGIRLLQDGLPVTTADGNNHNRVVDPLAAQYATIARGANAMRYGASTLGGAINFVTPTARNLPELDVSLGGGSHGHATARATAGHVFGDAFDALVTVETRQWDGYREHTEQQRAGLYANAGWQIADNVATRFYATALSNDQQLPGALTRAEFEADPRQANSAAVTGEYQLNVDTSRLANKTTWQIDEERLLEVGWSIEEQALFHPIVWAAADPDGAGPVPEQELFSLLIDTDHRDIGGMIRYRHALGDHELSLGLNYGTSDVDGGHYRNLQGRRNGLSQVIRNDATTYELFAVDRWHLDERTTLIFAAQTVSARRETRTGNVRNDTITRRHGSYERFNPRIGVVSSIGDGVSLYANVSRLFEPPTNFELEDNVAGGNAVLEAMQGTVLEIGTRGARELESAGRFDWDVAVYYAKIEDEILSVEDPGAPGTSLVTNFDRTIHAGIEAMLGASFAVDPAGARTIEPRLAMTVNDFAFDDDADYADNRLPAAPRYFVRGEVLLRGDSGFFVGPTFDLVGTRYADFANSYRVDSYRLIGLRAGWNGSRWRAFGEVRNVTDEEYVASHSVRNRALANDALLNAGEPLSAYFGVQWQIE